MASTYDISYFFEVTGMSGSGSLLYVCDSGNRRVTRLSMITGEPYDSYDMPANAYPLAVLVGTNRCYVLVNQWDSLLLNPRIDMLIFNLASPVTDAMTLWKTVSVSSVGINSGELPPQYGGLFLQYTGGALIAGCFNASGNKIVRMNLDGVILSTATLSASDNFYGMVFY